MYIRFLLCLRATQHARRVAFPRTWPSFSRTHLARPVLPSSSSPHTSPAPPATPPATDAHTHHVLGLRNLGTIRRTHVSRSSPIDRRVPATLAHRSQRPKTLPIPPTTSDPYPNTDLAHEPTHHALEGEFQWRWRGAWVVCSQGIHGDYDWVLLSPKLGAVPTTHAAPSAGTYDLSIRVLLVQVEPC